MRKWFSFLCSYKNVLKFFKDLMINLIFFLHLRKDTFNQNIIGKTAINVKDFLIKNIIIYLKSMSKGGKGGKSGIAELAIEAIKLTLNLADKLDYKRTIGGIIYNGTVRRLVYSGQYFDCGHFVQNPPFYINPNEKSNLKLSKKFGSYGVKGVVVYKFGQSQNERICFYFENPIHGRNYSGIKYYSNSSFSNYKIYCDVPKIIAGQKMQAQGHNGQLVLQSEITGGDHAGVGYTVRDLSTI